jgi:hypothetical protein
VLILDSLIKDLRDKAYIKKKSFSGNRIFYKDKTRGISTKNNKKDKKNNKTKYFYCMQENPGYDFSIYFETNIKKQKKIREFNKKKIRVKENRKYYKIETEEVLEEIKYQSRFEL